MTGFSASSCFSPAHTSSTRHPPSPPPPPPPPEKPLHYNFLAPLIASLTHLAAKLKFSQQGGSPKKFVSTVSHKAMKLVQMKQNRQEADHELDSQEKALWRRSILLGDKCQPLDFPGVIYYDEKGRQISELPPRSPRSPLLRSPLPGYLQVR